MKKETLTWRSEKRKVKELTPADYNPRKMTEQERRDLEDSIREFGAVIPIVVNVGKRENVLIGGHQRVTIYADLGIEETDVMVPSRELTGEEERRLNLRLNKNTGSWDFEKLKDMDLTLLLDVGFGDEELATLWDDVDVIDDEFGAGAAAKEIKVPKTKPGDVYILGGHRLMCGDSMKPEDVKKLMGADLADTIYCDPPYNIGLDYSMGMGELYHNKQSYGGTYSKKNDAKTTKDYAELLARTLDNALEASRPNTHVFYWCDENFIWMLQELYRERKLTLKRVCLWIKNNMNLKPQTAFNKVYEPCVYATRGKPYLNRAMTKLHEIMNKEVGTGNQVHEDIMEMITLWVTKRDAIYEHPTQKPVTLAEKPLKRCTSPGHIVLDLFGGSGSTLIACEQLNRKCRMMEQDPVFCDVIVNRWEVFANKKAKKA